MTGPRGGEDELDKDDKDVEAPPSRFDPWRVLAALTPARIGLGRAGAALRTPVHLELQAAHAAARDAVHRPWDPADFARALEAEGDDVLVVRSRARTRAEYLARPTTGRCLDDRDNTKIEECVRERRPEQGWDVALIVSDGLSAEAVERHGLPLVRALLASFAAAGLAAGPVVCVGHGRVAISDPIGRLVGARVAVIVLGERPGLSAADSLGIYLTFEPGPGRTDAERNCISNVHPPDGLDLQTAAAKAAWLAREAIARGYSGVQLKDEAHTGLALV